MSQSQSLKVKKNRQTERCLSLSMFLGTEGDREAGSQAVPLLYLTEVQNDSWLLLHQHHGWADVAAAFQVQQHLILLSLLFICLSLFLSRNSCSGNMLSLILFVLLFHLYSKITFFFFLGCNAANQLFTSGRPSSILRRAPAGRRFFSFSQLGRSWLFSGLLFPLQIIRLYLHHWLIKGWAQVAPNISFKDSVISASTSFLSDQSVFMSHVCAIAISTRPRRHRKKGMDPQWDEFIRSVGQLSQLIPVLSWRRRGEGWK